MSYIMQLYIYIYETLFGDIMKNERKKPLKIMMSLC